MLIAGLDEVGRGSLAGPVVSAIVAWEPGIYFATDSKSLTPKKRIKQFEYIKSVASGIGIGISSVEEIDNLNIRNATLLAMQRAFDNLKKNVDVLIIDGVDILPGINVIQFACPKGDSLIPVVSAASIVAKVIRDEIMVELSKLFPNYGWDKNKGYGTKLHLMNIRMFGPCIHHRKTFLHE